MNRHYLKMINKEQFSSVQFSRSVVSNSLWPHGLQHPRVSLSNTNSFSLFEFMSIELVMSSNHLILCHALLLLPLIIPSSGSFQWVSSLHQVTKILELQLQHQSFQWIFRTDFLYDWLVWSPCSPRNSSGVFSQPHSSKISVLWCSAFFMVQLSHAYILEKP